MLLAERILTNTCPQNYKFTGKERDAESGNDYAMARYDVNRLGRFSSPDLMAGSIADPQSLSRYAYVRNDAVNLTDPLGLNVDAGASGSNQCMLENQWVSCGMAYHLLDIGMASFGPTGGGWDPIPGDPDKPGDPELASRGCFRNAMTGEVWCPNDPLLSLKFWNLWGSNDPSPGDGGSIAELKKNLRDLFTKNPKCAALFGDDKNALKQLDISRIYPPNTFSPSTEGSVPADTILATSPHGAVYVGGNIFLGPKFFDQSTGVQETILIHELRHQAYNTGEPPLNSPAYPAHARKEDAVIVAACKTQMPPKKP